jgi:hypothetical protein
VANQVKKVFFDTKGALDRMLKPYERTMNSLEREKEHSPQKKLQIRFRELRKEARTLRDQQR